MSRLLASIASSWPWNVKVAEKSVFFAALGASASTVRAIPLLAYTRPSVPSDTVVPSRRSAMSTPPTSLMV